MTPEQRHYLTEGLRHRMRYYGARVGTGSDALTLALAWWAAWWKERADKAEVRAADPATRDMFD